MPVIKQVWQFQGGGRLGISWTEVYYVNATDFAAANNGISTILPIRLAALQRRFFLQKIRLSDTTQSRVTAIRNVNQAGTLLFPIAGGGSGNGTPDDPDSSAVYKLTSTVSPVTRSAWFRGLADEQVLFDQFADTWVLGPGLKQALDAWVTAIAAQGFLVYKHFPVSVLRPDYHVVSAAPIVGTNNTVFTTAENNTLFVGQTVRMHAFSAKDFPGLNGSYPVIAATATTFVIPYTMPRLAAQTAVSGMAKRWEADTTAVINSSASGFAYIGSHRTRSPFTGSRGARRSPLRGKRLSP